MKFKILQLCKDFLLYTGILRIFSPLNHVFFFLSNFNRLSAWTAANSKNLVLNDFYSISRDYNKRYQLYGAVLNHFKLEQKEIMYLEYGVANAMSFRWWTENNLNSSSSFHGFDTFEGLPEDWGGYKKGDMGHPIQQFDDERVHFYKGLFQDTLCDFINDNNVALKAKQKIIHLDADLFSSTIFVLSQLYQYLNKGDIILFDEFNVANHEYLAYKIFTEAFYVKLKPIAAVNNFYQAAFVVV